MKMYILLDNIRSLLNVGAVFRTADGAGFSLVYLTGITPTPPRKEISKTALGAENFVPWEYYQDPLEILDSLKAQWVRIVVLEQDPSGYSIDDYKNDGRDICLVVGNEVGWVQADIISLANDIIELPMLGKKQSLNVAVAAGICMYTLR
jgi:23S rRNA (guanosine2251-2'-O)-methyltransferase